MTSTEQTTELLLIQNIEEDEENVLIFAHFNLNLIIYHMLNCVHVTLSGVLYTIIVTIYYRM